MAFALTFFLSCSLVYFGLLMWFYYGWAKLSAFKGGKEGNTLCTVVIPARNEEVNIANCLKAVIAQTYDPSLFEIIFVDDNSSDGTVEIVKSIASQSTIPIRIITMDGSINQTYKKNAITKAIQLAKGDLILTTDADCIMGPEWLSTIVGLYEKEKPKIICSGVQFIKERNLFQYFQSLEFVGLNICTAGAISIGKPIMCNGANLAYEKKVFLELNGFEGSENIPSGDDTFLMLSIQSRYKNGVKFLKSEKAIVFTEAKPDWYSFVQQRKRWASKTRYYKSAFVKAVGGILLLTNIGLLCAIFSLPFYVKMSLAIIVIKLSADFILLSAGTKFFNRNKLLLNFLPEQLFYAAYVIYITLIAPFGTYSWKERTVKA